MLQGAKSKLSALLDSRVTDSAHFLSHCPPSGTAASYKRPCCEADALLCLLSATLMLLEPACRSTASRGWDLPVPTQALVEATRSQAAISPNPLPSPAVAVTPPQPWSTHKKPSPHPKAAPERHGSPEGLWDAVGPTMPDSRCGQQQQQQARTNIPGAHGVPTQGEDVSEGSV